MTFLLEIRPSDLFLRRQLHLQADQRQKWSKSGGFCPATSLETRRTFVADSYRCPRLAVKGVAAPMAAN
jgi:hypothetical protein